MNQMFIAYLLVGGIVVAFAMLIVVSIARSMDGSRLARPSAAPHAHAATTAAHGKLGDLKMKDAMQTIARMGTIEGLIAVASETASPAAEGKKPSGMQQVNTTLATVAGGLAIIGIGAAFFAGILNDPEPPVESAISAGALQGTLLSAGRRSEVVLIVPGSGPTDRNGDSPLGIRAQPLKLLAEGLAAEGISSVRVDKRGMFGSAAAGDPNQVSVDLYASDYRTWVDAIREQTGVKCVWLLGHSEGALMVSAAAQGRKDVCGLILVSGIGRRLGDAIRAQLRANPANAPIMDSALHALSELEAGRKVDTTGMNPALLSLFAPQVQDYLIDILSTEPVEVLRRAKKQALIIQGTTDLQTTIEDARLLDKAPRAHLELIKGMNHILKDAPLDRAVNFATYANPDLPIARGLIREIEDFIEDDD